MLYFLFITILLDFDKKVPTICQRRINQPFSSLSRTLITFEVVLIFTTIKYKKLEEVFFKIVEKARANVSRREVETYNQIGQKMRIILRFSQTKGCMQVLGVNEYD